MSYKSAEFDFRGEHYGLVFEEAGTACSHAIYSSDIGGYSGNNAIVSMATRFPSLQFVFFTDSLIKTSLSNLTIVHVKWKGADERLIAKYFKVNSAKLFPKTLTQTLWVDSNVELFDHHIINKVSSTELSLFCHDKRNNITQEIKDIIKHGKDSEKYMKSTINFLANQAQDLDRLQLYQGRIIFRKRAHSVAHFEELWWQYILSTTYRDQISLPVAVDISGVNLIALDPVLRDDYFVVYAHKKYQFRTLGGGYGTRIRFFISRIRFRISNFRRRLFK